MSRKEIVADEPVSRILCAARPCHPDSHQDALGTHKRGDHSSRSRIAPGLQQPTRGSQPRALSSAPPFVRRSELRASIRAGPALPSYLALLHAGFSVPRVLPPGRWALTPPFHPCQMRSTGRSGPLVLPQACHRGASITGGISFCGTFRSRVPCRELTPAEFLTRTGPLALPGALPCRGRLLRAHHGWSPDFPPARFPCEKRAGDHPAHPPFSLYTGKHLPRVWTHVGRAVERHFLLRSFSNWASSRMGTPRDLAFSNFEPGSAPTTT